MTTNLARYERIAPLYDLLDLPFERNRYRTLRPLLFQGLDGRLLDAGVGTGRNCAYYPPGADVSGIDISPAMLARAHHRCSTLAAAGHLFQMDVTAFHQQVPGLRELGRVVKPDGLIRLLEYVRPKGRLRRAASRVWQPWISWAYGASFDRQTEQHAVSAGLEISESRYVVDDLLKLLSLRRVAVS